MSPTATPSTLSSASDAALANQFTALNEAFLKTIQSQVGGKEAVDLSPCCNEYVAFAQSIRSAPKPQPMFATRQSPLTASKPAAAAASSSSSSASADGEPEEGDGKAKVVEGEDEDEKTALYVIPK
jgi:hypothetical protein